MKVFKFKPGRYYIGDPCYVFSYETWTEIGRQTDWFYKESLAEIKGKSLFGAHTAYGDGSYADEEGNIYSVDAGVIGVVPVEILEKNGEGQGGNIIDFYEPFSIYSEKGVFIIGNEDKRVMIDTR